jgi:hypothetical protein
MATTSTPALGIAVWIAIFNTWGIRSGLEIR